jgi:2,5-diamino-6-(ribosylamino)-4(3H)-pyrimidinone 5'-phosphate reductase
LPKVVVHNSISLDGSLTGFEPNMELHYQIVGTYQPDIYLVGSNTVKAGSTLYGEIPAEKEDDFKKPTKDSSLSYWVIPDTKGSLNGLLHFCRRYEYCRDVIVLISKQTPTDYIKYLKERNYDYHVVGETYVDLPKALDLLSEKYGAQRILADTGKILSNLLIEQNLVSEISLLVHPTIVGSKAYNIFGNISKAPTLDLRKKQVFPKGYIWLAYKIS